MTAEHIQIPDCPAILFPVNKACTVKDDMYMQIICILMDTVDNLIPVRVIFTYSFGNGVRLLGDQHMPRIEPHHDMPYLSAVAVLAEELLYGSHLNGGVINVNIYSAVKMHPSAVLMSGIVGQRFNVFGVAVGVIYKFIDRQSSFTSLSKADFFSFGI